MPTFSSMDDNFKNDICPSEKEQEIRQKTESISFVPKVFLTMFIGLLISAIIACGVGLLFSNLITKAPDEVAQAQYMNILLGILIGSALGVLVLSIVVPIVYSKGKHSVLVPTILYVVFMGLLLSSFTFCLPWWILGEAIGITSLLFGLMTLISLLSKGKMKGLTVVIIGLLIGIPLMVLANFIFIWTGLSDGSYLSWVISFAFLALIMFVTMKDIHDIKEIAVRGGAHDNNLVLFCALSIYTDFINLFIRIAMLLARARGNK